MVQLNPFFDHLAPNYLFAEMRQQLQKHQSRGEKLIDLSVGDTIEPCTGAVIHGLRRGVDKLARRETFRGYGPEQGSESLQKAIIALYAEKRVSLNLPEVFINDGAKPDLADIQSLFSLDAIVALQDPVYPVYRDSNILAGRTTLCYMPCTEENGFIPRLPPSGAGLLYLCSPNNPTGAVFDHEQLQQFVDYARRQKAVIIFDAAYSWFIQNPTLPRSIYEIEGAKECAIEINSFSKFADFTGVRLGWTVIPKELVVENSHPDEVNQKWFRRVSTHSNGVCNIAEEGGLGILSKEGMRECYGLVQHYLGNAQKLRQGLEQQDLTVFGGHHAPYLWIKAPNGMSSMDFWNVLLDKTGILGTPGSGFGPSGEGYVRFHSFCTAATVDAVVERLQRL